MGGIQSSLISQKHRQHAQKQCNARSDLLTIHTKTLFEQTYAEQNIQRKASKLYVTHFCRYLQLVSIQYHINLNTIKFWPCIIFNFYRYIIIEKRLLTFYRL